jgi:hypothetical protein
MRVIFLLLVVTGLAAGDNKLDLADKLRSRVFPSEYPAILIESGLIQYELSDSCWAKMLDEEGGVHRQTFVTRWVAEAAKRMGFGDVSAVEGSNSVDVKENLPKVKAMVEQWKPKLSLRVEASKTNCDTLGFRLLHGYLTEIAEFIARQDWVPSNQQIHVTLRMDDSLKTIAVKQEGGKFVVSGPATVELPEWNRLIVDGLTRAARR